MQNQLSRLSSYVSIRVDGEATLRFINMCMYKSIELWDVVSHKDNITAKTTIKDFYKLREVCRVTKSKVRIIKRKGIAFTIFRYRKHYSFIVGIVIACILITLWSKFVWDITFVGNSKYTKGVLLEYLDSLGVHSGMYLADVDCANIEASIRNEYNEITWVSAKISGTKIEISIKENEVIGEGVVADAKERDIVATGAGVIESIVTRKGTPLVKVGDTVEKGQILVSGVVKIMDDAGVHIANMYTESDADIMIRTTKQYSDSLKKEHEKKVYTGKTKRKSIVGITNTNMEFGIVLKEYENADVETTISPLKLTDSFVLPVYTGSKIYHEYNMVTEKYDEESAKAVFNKHFLQYIKELSQNKVQILQYDVKMYNEGDCFSVKGTVDIVAPLTEYKPVTDIEIIIDEENKDN
ncbi:MAG: sporulation protein YqfD [Lachnospira sp.]|nr:sporulation protein YqfD [Lachnospira sp.]